jgi:arylsulfatase A-like enzyme
MAAMNAKPNLIIVMTDQQRADLMSIEEFPLDTTPGLQAMAARGARFAKAYTSSPVCMPARISMFTGRFPRAHGIRCNHRRGLDQARYKEDMLHMLKRLGYRTALVGKNHTYIKPPEDMDCAVEFSHMVGHIRPNHREEDEAFDRWMANLLFWVGEEPTPFPVSLQYPVRIVDHALEFLENRDEDPFFLWVSFPEPHNPFQVPEPYFDMFPPETLPDRACGPEVLEEKGFPWDWEGKLIEHYHPGFDNLWRRLRSNYCGMVRLIDDQVSRLLDYLNTSGLIETTHLLFLSDHGDFVGDYGLIRKGVGLAECLVRIPLLWLGPGIQQNVVLDDFVSIVDVFPTVCDLLDEELPEGVQGRSLLPMLTGNDYPKSDFQSIFAEYGFGGLPWTDAGQDGFTWDQTFIKTPETPLRKADMSDCKPTRSDGRVTFDELNSVTLSGSVKMVRKGDWKLVYNFMGNHELYHLAEDPFELTNRIDDHTVRGIREDLKMELIHWLVRTEDQLPFDRYSMQRVPGNYMNIRDAAKSSDCSSRSRQEKP